MGKNGGGQENSTWHAIGSQLSLSTLPHLLVSEEGLRDLPALPSWEIQNPGLLPDLGTPSPHTLGADIGPGGPKDWRGKS